MKDIQIKGRIAEILEGGKVLRQDLFRELRNTEFSVSASKFDKILKSMLKDETVRKILVENKKVGRVEEYFEHY